MEKVFQAERLAQKVKKNKAPLGRYKRYTWPRGILEGWEVWQEIKMETS